MPRSIRESLESQPLSGLVLALNSGPKLVKPVMFPPRARETGYKAGSDWIGDERHDDRDRARGIFGSPSSVVGRHSHPAAVAELTGRAL
jgi:hypothetical protein